MSPKTTEHNKPPFYALYIGIFLLAFHSALPLYITSSFLSTYFSDTTVGFLYAGASLLTLIILTRLSRILNRFGNRRTALFFVFLEMLAFAGLAYFKAWYLVLPVFVMSQILVSLILFNFDVFFESFSKDATTGSLRGTMLTVFNTAILLGPLTTGIILSDGDYYKVFLVALALLVPVFWILLTRLHDFKDARYEHVDYLKTLRRVVFARHPDDIIRHVVIANLLLHFFFSWMVVYMPLYLHTNLGFSWAEIGVIFTIMLLPFVLFEAPVGKIADARGNEIFFIKTGFLITAFFTGILAFIASSALPLWALLLFGTRVGMSFVEVASESYFFKHINATNTNVLSVFRNARPIAYLAGPATASILLFVIPINYLFAALALVMLYGAWNARTLEKIS
ncbi:MAG: MFS transporter [Parcubacteria group bacterium]|nr:MFS transporter [Parcubacteria group bacterium]MBI3075284.1 MFS transporter [Parcubacteria group bacterium]